MRKLPWLIGVGGVLVFWITLGHWISLPSLSTVARVCGWLWQPDVGRPLTFVAFAPFGLLPDAWVPLALNLFNALAAGLALMQLARSVALMRHDVAPVDRMRKGTDTGLLVTPTAWIPPVLAALVCGLQPGFWEHATSATGEMISLLLFAFALRSLLEFRLDQKQAWLSRGVCAYAAGMSENWLMIGYLPVFVAGIIWVKGFSPFLSPRFLLRMTGWALLGLSLYLVTPTLAMLSGSDSLDFWTALKAQWRPQKQALLILRSPGLRLLVLTGLLPFVLLAIRWRSHTVQLADDSRLGVFLVKATGHVAHTLFFVASLWLALNPVLTATRLELSLPLLPYHYVWALVTGYAAGYFLLFRTGRVRRPAKWPAYALGLLLVLVPLALVAKHFPDLRMTNGPALREYARGLQAALPAGKSVVLSEEAGQLLLLRAELAATRPPKDAMLVETSPLILPRYHQLMRRQYGARWPERLTTNRTETVGPVELSVWISILATNEPVIYAHPSAGFFLEAYRAEPFGVCHRLVPRNGPGEPPLAEAVVVATEQVWQQRWTNHLGALAEQFAAARERATRWRRPPYHWLRLAERPNPVMSALSAAYGKSLNHWGVQMQRAGRESEAIEWYRRALAINPGNLAAHLNLTYATRSQQGDRSRFMPLQTWQEFAELFGQYENWWDVLNHHGPVDEPTFLLHTGRILLLRGQMRQAIATFARCAELAPDWPAATLWLAQSHYLARDFARALQLTEAIPVDRLEPQSPGLGQLLICRMSSQWALGQTNAAMVYLEEFLAEHGGNEHVLGAAATLFEAAGQLQRELAMRERLTQRDPNNPDRLTRQGMVEVRLSRFEAAIATLTKALTLAPGNKEARQARAVAQLVTGQLEAARRDYADLLKQPGGEQAGLFGLGNVAWRERDTNAVIEYYQQFLSNSAAQSAPTAIAAERLRALSSEVE